MDKKNMINEEEKKNVEDDKAFKSEKRKNLFQRFVIAVMTVIIIILLFLRGCTGCSTNAVETGDKPLNIDKTQNTYVKPESPIDRSQRVTFPGWGGFTIPAYAQNVDKGFEFHNPQENIWYEDEIYINGKFLEKLVVDSGEAVDLNHYLKLAKINASVDDVTSYNEFYFAVSDDEDDDGNAIKTLEAIGFFEGEQNITVKCDDGSAQTITVKCKQNYYLMNFALYLGTPDDEANAELLYQSDLVEPGMYIQKMRMTKALAPGEYDAYVLVQPYRSDKVTKTNSGTIKIKLTVG